jgi:hypothetical protein
LPTRSAFFPPFRKREGNKKGEFALFCIWDQQLFRTRAKNKEDKNMKRTMLLTLFCFIAIVFLSQGYAASLNPEPEYVGCINYVKGGLMHTHDGSTVQAARGMVIYKDSVINYAPEYTKRDGKVQIICKNGGKNTITVFPASFNKSSVATVSAKELKELGKYIGGNLVLSSKHGDPIFEWYCNIKVLDEEFARDFTIIISKTQSSFDTGSVKPLVFKVNPGVVISAIECSLWEADDYGKKIKKIATVEWKSEKDDWMLDFSKLPSDKNKLYVLETGFIDNNDKHTVKDFIYKIIDKTQLQAIQNEALRGITGEKTEFKKKSALIQNFEAYDLILPSIEKRKNDGLIVNGLLDEIWFD